MSLHQRARAFAVAAHGDQRYDGQPYCVHLDAVAALVRPYGHAAMALAFLHDTVEQAGTPAQAIECEFGAHMAACVHLLTDPPGLSRQAQKAISCAKLAQASPLFETALIVKAADRLANMRACLLMQDRALWVLYSVEHAPLRQAAYRPGLCDPLWAAMGHLLAVADC